MCSSGDSTAKAAEDQSLAFQQQLQNVFTKQWGAQSDILKHLTDTLTNNINKPQGYGQPALDAMRTGATDTIAGQYDNAQKSLQNSQFINGSENLPSGVNAMQTGALKRGQAGDTASAQNSITLADENLKQQNYWNSIQALSGVSQQYNPNGTAGNANGAGNTVAGLSNAVTNSKMAELSPINSLISGGAGMGAALLGKPKVP